MTSDNDFLQAIIDSPEEDASRLRYADWLEQHGQAERAEFIRVQCQLAGLPKGSRQRRKLKEKEADLFEKYGQHWLGPLHDLLKKGLFRRGFLETISVPFKVLLTQGDAIFASGPVQQVTILGRRPDMAELAKFPYLARLTGINLWGCRLDYRGLRQLLSSSSLAA